jgi:hypothetical protein
MNRFEQTFWVFAFAVIIASRFITGCLLGAVLAFGFSLLFDWLFCGVAHDEWSFHPRWIDFWICTAIMLGIVSAALPVVKVFLIRRLERKE